MLLKALKYTRFEGEPREWKIIGTGETKEKAYAQFDNLNLFVGKNASGKSRTLNVIREISYLLKGYHTTENTFYPSEKYELVFKDEENTFEYSLGYKKRVITEEVLIVNKQKVLDRQDYLHTVDPAVPAITVIENQYTYPLIKWGKSLKSFIFSNQFEKKHLVNDYTRLEDTRQNPEENGYLIYTFYKGIEELEDDYIREVVKCMQYIGYPVTDISIRKINGGYGLCVEEEGKYIISQHEMAQGMFRALALFIQLVYAEMKKLDICVLIDDIGEGIDYDRAKDMIGVVVRKVSHSDIQFFMTTNDRYIMNKIPLRYWTIIDRKKEESIFYSYNNSKEVFEDFKYTGLNNFDFLATDFYKNGFGEEESNSDTVENIQD